MIQQIACPKCKKIKGISRFGKNKANGNGLKYWCKNCERLYKRYWRKTLGRSKFKAGLKKYQQSFKGKEAKSKATKRWNKSDNGKAYWRNYFKNRYYNDPVFRIAQTLRWRFKNAFKYHRGSYSVLLKYLVGCNYKTLRKHLEIHFQEGMSWSNYGLFGWHIDHITPCSHFNLSDPKQQKQCFHYTNLQPLWAIDNLRKGKNVRIPESANKL